jgi:hypothetical protein
METLMKIESHNTKRNNNRQLVILETQDKQREKLKQIKWRIIQCPMYKTKTPTMNLGRVICSTFEVLHEYCRQNQGHL